MKILTDTIYISYARQSKAFFMPEPELLSEFKQIEEVVLKLLGDMNKMRSVRRFNYTPLIYACFAASILSTILVYYFGYLTIAALVFFALTTLFVVLKQQRNRAIDKELSNIVFVYLEELHATFEVKIKSSEFFTEFRNSPAVVLKPRNPFNEIFKSGDMKFIVDDKSHLSVSLSVNQQDLAAKGLGTFFNKATEQGLLISTKKKAELYNFSKTKQENNDSPYAVNQPKTHKIVSNFNIASREQPRNGQGEGDSQYSVSEMRNIVYQGLNN